MTFNELDAKMRIYENNLDQIIVPGMQIVVRLDGHKFSGITEKEFEKPFDDTFHNMMLATVKECMDSGFRIIYGYTQSDEISLLLHPDDNTFGRKTRKINSILAGAASARFSLEFGKVVKFDSRVAALPTNDLVADEFLWRQEDCNRNALNSYCYWTLRKQGQTAQRATFALNHLSVSGKNELLYQYGKINYNNVTPWHKRGTGFYYKPTVITGHNPVTNETIQTTRRKLYIDEMLPYGDDYRNFLLQQLNNASAEK